jgi:hypothetical protein
MGTARGVDTASDYGFQLKPKKGASNVIRRTSLAIPAAPALDAAPKELVEVIHELEVVLRSDLTLASK